jgi:plastocyanin
MLRRGRSGRRVGFAAGLVLALTLFVGGLAFASAPIVGQADNTYRDSTYTIDQGEVAQLQVTGSTHNATARLSGPDGGALFRSATISSGNTGVNGTQYLPSGDYAFFCTIHPSTMQATLHVTGNGTPAPRPSLTLSLKNRSLSKAIKKGILVSVNASTKVDGVTLTAKLGKATLGRATVSLAAGSQADLVKLSKAGKSKLRGRDTAKITVRADVPFGTPASTKAKFS